MLHIREKNGPVLCSGKVILYHYITPQKITKMNTDDLKNARKGFVHTHGKIIKTNSQLSGQQFTV